MPKEKAMNRFRLRRFPRRRLNYVDEAISLFTQFSLRHGLAYTIIIDAPVEVMWRFPVQETLSLPMTLGLQNNDELNFDVPGFRSYFFPFPLIVQKFESCVDAWVLGEARIVRHQRLFRFASVSTLEVFSDGVWIPLYKAAGTSWSHAELVIQNTAASPA